jgi:type VI secretion system protein ImpC
MAQHLELDLSVRGGGAPRHRGARLRLLVIGDFSVAGEGGIGAGREPLWQRRAQAVDVDTVDAWLAARGLGLTVDVDGEPWRLAVLALDDLHPDALYREGAAFQRLERLRQRLGSADGFAEAAAEVRRLVGGGQGPRVSAPGTVSPPAASEDDRTTLARLLGGRPGGSAPAPASAAARIIQEAVGPHVVAPTPAHGPVYGAALDALATGRMRALLSTPALRALEARWRALRWLVVSLETGEELTLHVLDLSREELAGDVLSAGADLERSVLGRLLLDQGPGTPGGEPWSLIVTDFSFGPTVADARLLAGLAALASAAGGPCLAGAEPTLVGAAGAAELADPAQWGPVDPAASAAWDALRASPLARWVGLAMPRLLLRLPYGRRTDRVESFAFEEVADPSEREALVWGNPAYGCALLIARAFAASGWACSPGDVLDLEDLPALTYDDEGETRLLPCAEVLLSERAAEAILARGPMPFMSYRNRPTVRLARFQSLAEPPTALAGPWR